MDLDFFHQIDVLVTLTRFTNHLQSILISCLLKPHELDLSIGSLTKHLVPFVY